MAAGGLNNKNKSHSRRRHIQEISFRAFFVFALKTLDLRNTSAAGGLYKKFAVFAVPPWFKPV